MYVFVFLLFLFFLYHSFFTIPSLEKSLACPRGHNSWSSFFGRMVLAWLYAMTTQSFRVAPKKTHDTCLHTHTAWLLFASRIYDLQNHLDFKQRTYVGTLHSLIPAYLSTHNKQNTKALHVIVLPSHHCSIMTCWLEWVHCSTLPPWRDKTEKQVFLTGRAVQGNLPRLEALFKVHSWWW